jgi:tRNA(adenine34) deaminase
MNYELFMGEALAEAGIALEAGERPVAAVAVVNDAMVARARDRVRETKDPTAHAVVTALREAARRLGPEALADATVFCTREPCPMCVGALLESDVGALVYAVPNIVDGAAGTVIQLAQHPGLRRRLQVVSGIRQAEAEDLFATHRAALALLAERSAGPADEGLAARA